MPGPPLHLTKRATAVTIWASVAAKKADRLRGIWIDRPTIRRQPQENRPVALTASSIDDERCQSPCPRRTT
jgi:hypothetical protein